MILEESEIEILPSTIGSQILRGKTGWALRSKMNIGWFVGWVEKQGQVYTFVSRTIFNQKPKSSAGSLAKEHAITALKNRLT